MVVTAYRVTLAGGSGRHVCVLSKMTGLGLSHHLDGGGQERELNLKSVTHLGHHAGVAIGLPVTEKKDFSQKAWFSSSMFLRCVLQNKCADSDEGSQH